MFSYAYKTKQRTFKNGKKICFMNEIGYEFIAVVVSFSGGEYCIFIWNIDIVDG